MSTVVYRNALMLVDGASIQANLNALGMEFSAEMLDNTGFGTDTRLNKGGLFMASITGEGLAESGDGLVEAVIFADVGVDDTVVALFPDGVTEGALTTGRGYAMKTVASEMKLGGPVGSLLGITFKYESRGID